MLMTYLRKDSIREQNKKNLSFVNFSENKECSSCTDRTSKSHFRSSFRQTVVIYVSCNASVELFSSRKYERIQWQTPSRNAMSKTQTHSHPSIHRIAKLLQTSEPVSQPATVNWTKMLECICICYRIHTLSRLVNFQFQSFNSSTNTRIHAFCADGTTHIYAIVWVCVCVWNILNWQVSGYVGCID